MRVSASNVGNLSSKEGKEVMFEKEQTNSPNAFFDFFSCTPYLRHTFTAFLQYENS
jgi:hypothetical protein